jgi:hypothetical protein
MEKIGSGYSSSPRQRFDVGERELRVGRDVVRNGGALAPLYRAGVAR